MVRKQQPRGGEAKPRASNRLPPPLRLHILLPLLPHHLRLHGVLHHGPNSLLPPPPPPPLPLLLIPHEHLRRRPAALLAAAHNFSIPIQNPSRDAEEELPRGDSEGLLLLVRRRREALVLRRSGFGGEGEGAKWGRAGAGGGVEEKGGGHDWCAGEQSGLVCEGRPQKHRN